MQLTITNIETKLSKRPKYATIGSLKDILSSAVSKQYPPTTLAVNVLSGTKDKYTNAPYFVLKYLHDNQGRDIEVEEVLTAGEKAGYLTGDLKWSLKEFVPYQAHVGTWWDSKTKKSYARWYEPNELTKSVQECLDRERKFLYE